MIEPTTADEAAPMTPERLAEIQHHDGGFATVRSVLGSNSAETHRHELLAEVERLTCERASYVDSYQEWAVKLSGGTHLDCRGEEDARDRAKAYHARLMVCDVLATDWREVEAAPDPADGAGDTAGDA